MLEIAGVDAAVSFGFKDETVKRPWMTLMKSRASVSQTLVKEKCTSRSFLASDP